MTFYKWFEQYLNDRGMLMYFYHALESLINLEISNAHSFGYFSDHPFKQINPRSLVHVIDSSADWNFDYSTVTVIPVYLSFGRPFDYATNSIQTETDYIEIRIGYSSENDTVIIALQKGN